MNDNIESWPSLPYKISTGCGIVHVSISLWQNDPFRVMIQMGKNGHCHNSFMEAIGRLLSWGLQAGGSLNDAAQHLMGLRCARPFREELGDKNLSCLDGLGQVLMGQGGCRCIRSHPPQVEIVNPEPLNPECPKGG